MARNDEPPQDEPMEVLPPVGPSDGATERMIKGGYALMKASNDSLIAMSVVKPRDVAQVRADVMNELEAFPTFAEDMYYLMEWESQGKKVEIKGIGIDGSMLLLRNYPYAVAGSVPYEETDDDFTYMGSVTDLQKGIRIDRTGTVSKWYRRKRDGKMIRWRQDQFTQLRQKAASIAVRNAILKLLPLPLQHVFFERAMQIAAQQDTKKATQRAAAKHPDQAEPTVAQVQKEKVAEVVKRFAPLGVEKKHLKVKLGKALEKMTETDVGVLRGIYNSIKQGHTDVFQQFGIGGPPEDGPAVDAPEEDPLGGGEVVEE